MCFVGDIQNKIDGFIYIVDKKIALPPIEAFSACFSYYIGLNAEYQTQSKSVWTFIQRICNVSTPLDEQLPFVETFLQELRNDSS